MEQQQQPLWTIEDLSTFLRRGKTSIHSDLSRNPASLPPAIRIPGTRRILFDPATVLAWVNGFTTQPAAPAAPEQPRLRRGRPTKAEQIARRG